MAIRGPEFPVPILTREEVIIAVDFLASESSGGTAQSRLTSLEWIAALLEERIVAMRDVDG